MLNGRGLQLDGEELPLYSGAIHYWRLERASWRAALRAIKGLGLRMVETYAPWGVHERTPGVFDFGEFDANKDLGAFLDLVAEEGLSAFVRPGPHINAELTFFGLPERIVRDPQCQAQGPDGEPVLLCLPPSMFAVPSYASQTFLAQTADWYRAVGKVIAPRLHPRGPVKLLQVDNEGAFYFCGGSYQQDYHPDARQQWTHFVQTRYRDVERAAAAHRQPYAAWEDIAPPTKFEATRADDLALHLDWAQFQEALLTAGLSRLRDTMALAGMQGVPIVHNMPPGERAEPLHLPALDAALDLVGFDYYHRAAEYRTVKERTLYLSGNSPLPYAPELGAGAMPWFAPLSKDDSLFTALVACAFGLRGFNLYMAVQRDRWYGAPIQEDGGQAESYAQWQRLFEALNETRFHALWRESEVAVVIPREYQRLSRATHMLGAANAGLLAMLGAEPFAACSAQRFSFERPVQVAWWQSVARVTAALSDAGVPFVLLDSEAPSERWRGHRLIIAPMFEFASAPYRERLAQAAADGAHILYGPDQPSLDGCMLPALWHEPPSAQQIDLSSDGPLGLALGTAIQDLDLAAPFSAEPRPVETAVHRDADGDAVLFVINPSREQTLAHVSLPRPLRLTDTLEAGVYEGDDRVSIPLQARQVRMFRLQQATRTETDARP